MRSQRSKIINRNKSSNRFKKFHLMLKIFKNKRQKLGKTHPILPIKSITKLHRITPINLTTIIYILTITIAIITQHPTLTILNKIDKLDKIIIDIEIN